MAVTAGRPICANLNRCGCNWIADPASVLGLCFSCRLTRTRPADADAVGLAQYWVAEAAKRRLIFGLDELELPIMISDGFAGLAFDLLSSTQGKIITGHLNGIITLDLAESNDSHREALRQSMDEPYRTVLGHFRHEIGHFYWDLLVNSTSFQAPFKLIFGDDFQDYQAAIKSYYNRSDRSYDRSGFISEYATSHPWEDWAETFAHFLHILSTLDSLAGLPLALDERARRTLTDPYLESDFEALLALWTPLSRGLNELNRSLGMSDAYPFDISPAVKGKLHLVHMAISAFREQQRLAA